MHTTPIGYGYSRRFLYVALAGTIVLGVPLALLFVAQSVAAPGIGSIAAAAFAVTIVSAGVWTLSHWLRWRGPVLDLSDEGLTYHPYRLGPIAWADIERAWIARGRRRSVSLVLELRDVDAYRPTDRALVRQWRRAVRDHGGGDIAVELSGLQIPDVDALAAFVQSRGDAARAEAGWPDDLPREPPVS